MYYICDRIEYDRFQHSQIRLLLIGSEEGFSLAAFRELVDQQYPKTTAQAIAELRFRGFDAKEVSAFAFTPRRMIGGVPVWSKDDIDRYADYLAEMDKLMPDALWRREVGMTWAQERENIRVIAEQREAEYVEATKSKS